MKTFFALIAALLLATPATSNAREKAPKTSSPVSKAVRVEVQMKDVHQWDSPSTRIRFFVQTGSEEVPMVCIADNAGFPNIAQFSARQRKVEGKSGVVVDIDFTRPVSLHSHKSAAMAINLWQPNLTKSTYPVLPSDGKEFSNRSDKDKKRGTFTR